MKQLARQQATGNRQQLKGNMKVFLNGKFVSLEDAKVSILDRGFLYGDGVFETMRSYKGRIFMLEKHVERLFVALKILRIKIPHTKNKLYALTNRVLEINKLSNAYIKLLVSRGVGYAGLDISGKSNPTVLIYADKLAPIPYKIYQKGIKTNFSCIDKNEKSFISRIKSLNYLDNILARDEVKRASYDEVIFTNTKGFVTEAASSNIFVVKKGAIITPPPTAGLLPGITREVIMELIKKHTNNKIYEEDIRPAGLLKSDEIFLTNSILEVIPVVQLGHHKIGSGKPGVYTRHLHMMYRREVEFINQKPKIKYQK